ncbi:MAG: peptide-methionine (R)-S-oxide reductase [Solirubrobacteraceae bacterium]|nr:peptide-methionine (R)-S-oxide reductase [Solirubrobacteraceae bacterium]
MPVYVDDAHIPWRGRNWSHMVADTPEELYRAAASLGLGPEHAQDKGRTLHYDLPDEWRERAIALGLATPITWRELVRRRRTIARGAAAGGSR